MPATPPLPDLSRLRELGDELLGELSALVPNLSDRTKAHVSLVDAIVRKLDCGGPVGSVLAMLGLGNDHDADPAMTAPAEPEAAVIPITKKAPVRKAPAKKAPVKKAQVKKAPASKRAPAVKKAPVKKAPASKSGELAIPGYDSLAASQVIPRLDSLSPADLEALRLHELGGRGRRTILTRIAQIQGR